MAKTETLDLLRKAMTKIDLFRSLGHFSWLANQSANNRLELMVTKNSYQFGISKFVCVVRTRNKVEQACQWVRGGPRNFPHFNKT